MPQRSSEAVWEGSLREGSGKVKLGSGAFEGAYSFGTRFEDKPGTNPEELIAAAHAGCFSMALSAGLGRGGFTPRRIQTKADVMLEKVGDGFKITSITLRTEASIPNITEEQFREHAEKAKSGCPVSQALAGTEIRLDARLLQG